MMNKKPRSYPVPATVAAELNTTQVTIDEIELIASACSGVSGTWARKVLAKEDRTTINQILDSPDVLPVGLGEYNSRGDFVLDSLALGSQTWGHGGWRAPRLAVQASCGACAKRSDKEDWEDLDHDFPDVPCGHEHGEYDDYDDDDDDDDDDDFITSLETALNLSSNSLTPVPAEDDYGVPVDLAIETDAALPESATLEGIEPYAAVDQCPTCGAHLQTGKQILPLDESDVASAVRALSEGATVVIFKPYTPVAHLSAPMVAATLETAGDKDVVGIQDLPPGSKYVAVVDELDKGAVLDLLGVAPGPIVFVRENQSWVQDESWRKTLTGIAPPPVVTLEDEALISSVISQIDSYDPEAEKKERAERKKIETSESSDSSALTSAIANIKRDSEDVALQALIAASAKKLNPAAGAAGAERLRQYWGYGEGAAKIRWGTKGDWRRCVKQLSKYLGPRSKGYCNLMHARVTGTWPNGKGAKAIPNPATSAEAVVKQLSR